VEIAVTGGVVVDIRYLVFGCPAAIAGAEELVRQVKGAPLLRAAAVSEERIAQALSLDAAKRACSNLAVDAFHQALECAWPKLAECPARLSGPDSPVGEGAADRGAVVVGMSGGVDSAVAALELSLAGYRVVGVTFRLWSDPVCARGQGCCSPETIRAARHSAHALGLPHLTVDIQRVFVERVVDGFVREYGDARTPNPCVRCNADVRFAMLASTADILGIHWIATGHYARLLHEPTRLLRGRDLSKDQSYVLAQVPSALLDRTLFPLGDLDKSTSRRLAREAGLPVHDAPESQEICFIPDNDYRRFLRERLGEREGPILGPHDEVLGRHGGLFNYTIGQRKGLGGFRHGVLYVTGLRPSDQAVLTGPAEALRVNTVRVAGLVRHRKHLPPEAHAQLRSSGRAVPVAIRDEGEELELTTLEETSSVAPGQTAVLYAGEEVLAAGTIHSTRA
jgi:tRNA-uridine 2-sulfurtransferase